MSEKLGQPEDPNKSNEAVPVRRHVPGDVVNTWLKPERLTREIFKPSMLRPFNEQQSWLKAMSGAAAMSSDFTRLYSTPYPRFDGALADFERTRRLFGGFNLVYDASSQQRALTSIGMFPAFHEAKLAHQSMARLIKPLDFPQITRDLTGLSDALASVAGMIPSPVFEIGREIGTIASSAIGSWRIYLNSLPSKLDPSELFHVQAAARGVLGLTASSAILLGDDSAIGMAEEWELAPAEMRERMRDGLRQISPRLVVRLDGAWDAVTHAGPDAVSQAANSAIEVIDWTLRLGCDEADLESWVTAQAKPSIYRDNSGRPTRQARIRYLLRSRDFEAEFVAATAFNLNALHRELQKLKHTHGEHDAAAVARLLPSVEAVLFLIVE